MNPDTRIEGSVERVTFHSDETGFCVLRVKARGQRNLATVVGTLPNVVPGEWIEASGDWTVNKQHGRQFQAETIKTAPPDSLEGIEKFLGSGLVKGIGPVYAAKLVEAFGKDIFDVIETRSALLEKVEGIGRVRRARIKDGWNETRAVRSIIAFLMSHGVSTARAFRIHKQYGEEAIRRVKEDPYCLARDIRGIGFKSADKMAASLGIEKTSDLRARAGVEYVLLEITQEGHCAFPRRELVEKAVEILDIPADIVERAIDHGLENRRLVEEPRGPHGDALLYLTHLHKAETALTADLLALAAGAHPCPPIRIEKAIEWCEEKTGLELAPAQREAIRMGVVSKTMVMTGGPGVGKTTLVNAILGIFTAKKLNVVLCAPTGRAAKRMSEATGRPAKTIHRLLAYDAKTGGFKHGPEHPLSGDVFIVDEASMIDLQLAWQLVRAIPTRAALLLVGDVDQLPSVGPGSVLRDIIESGAVPVIRLTHVFRQAARSDIITNAHLINEGRVPVPGKIESHSDFYMVEAEDADKGADLVIRFVKENIPKRFHLDPTRDIQVLTPMHRGSLGAQSLNAALQQALNPSGAEVQRFGCTFRVNDKVMQTENDYDKEVFNGDIGRVRKIREEDRELVVDFEGRPVTYDFQELDELAPSYAITIHKSQGSEYPCVVIPVHTQHYIMLQRNLLYTAVTRGRKLVVLIGTWKALGIAVGRADAHRRITTLRERLEEKRGTGHGGASIG